MGPNWVDYNPMFTLECIPVIFVGEGVEPEILDVLVTEKDVTKGVNRKPACLRYYHLGTFLLEDL